MIPKKYTKQSEDMLQLLPIIKHTNEHMKITQTLQTNSHKTTIAHMHAPSLFHTLRLLHNTARINKATIY